MDRHTNIQTMRKILLLVLTATTITVSGQNHLLGVKGGANWTNVTASNFLNDKDFRTGLASGLTYDFLYAMAKDLQDRNALMLLGAGPKSNQPLILRRGSTPYRGFLEGKVADDKYCLTLHFSNMELKLPEPTAEETDA